MITATLFTLVLAPNLAAQDWLDRILSAAQLPVAAAEAREEGVSGSILGNILEIIRRRGLPAEDARWVLEEEVRVVREGGPKENFGAFVQTQLDAGLRGRALADAIHEEHRRRGMGRPDDRGRGRDDDRGRDNNANDARDRGQGQDRGRDNNRPNQSRDTTKRGRP